MRYDEITQMVTGSSPQDWEKLEPGPPFYLDRLGEIIEFNDGVPQYRLEVDTHYYLAVYKPDVSLRLAWGLKWGDGFEVDEHWGCPDRSADRRIVDAFWQGGLVARWTVLLVDGGRCYLPDADREYVKTDDTMEGYQGITWTAKASEIALARLVDRIAHPMSEFERYFSQTGIIEVPDQ